VPGLPRALQAAHPAGDAAIGLAPGDEVSIRFDPASISGGNR
jgi:hypothetical protein